MASKSCATTNSGFLLPRHFLGIIFVHRSDSRRVTGRVGVRVIVMSILMIHLQFVVTPLVG